MGESRNWQQRPHLSWELGAGSWEGEAVIAKEPFDYAQGRLRD
jgi:hypothetical protein